MANPMNKILALIAAMIAHNRLTAPIFNLFEFGIQNGQTAAYDQFGENNIRTSLTKETGTIAMHSVKQKANPQITYMIEIYADDAAYQTHIASSQYQKFREAAPQILTDHKHNLVPQYLADKKIEPNRDTSANLIRIAVKTEANEQFAQIVKTEMRESIKKENGVLARYAATDKDQPNQWHFFEIYANDAAYQAHRKTPHFQKYLQETADLLQDKTFIEITPTLLMNKGVL